MQASPSERRIYAVVPAAGLSRRMGTPKLLLPLGGSTVIACLLDVFAASGVDGTFVLVRGDDQPLIDEVRRHSGHVVTAPHATRDMRHSVQLLLQAIERDCAPCDQDAWLLSPADHPTLSVSLVTALIESWRADPAGILVPTYRDRRGHPTIFAWEYARRVDRIPPDCGLNWLLTEYAKHVAQHETESPEILFDLDTPGDYERLKTRFPS